MRALWKLLVASCGWLFSKIFPLHISLAQPGGMTAAEARAKAEWWWGAAAFVEESYYGGFKVGRWGTTYGRSERSFEEAFEHAEKNGHGPLR